MLNREMVDTFHKLAHDVSQGNYIEAANLTYGLERDGDLERK